MVNVGKQTDRFLDQLAIMYDQRKQVKAQIEVWVGLGQITVDQGFTLIKLLDDTKVDEVVV